MNGGERVLKDEVSLTLSPLHLIHIQLFNSFAHLLTRSSPQVQGEKTWEFLGGDNEQLWLLSAEALRKQCGKASRCFSNAITFAMNPSLGFFCSALNSGG
jgi:hypothetical protein